VRKLWSKLRPATQKRKLAFYRRQGLSDSQIKSRYNRGTLGPQSAARGHARTPERPERASRQPARYREYLAKRPPGPGPGVTSPPGPGPRSIWDQAFDNMVRQIGSYHKFRRETVRANIGKMTEAEARWTAQADAEEIRARARMQRASNKWFYH
jgi:hypothetical protein